MSRALACASPKGEGHPRQLGSLLGWPSLGGETQLNCQGAQFWSEQAVDQTSGSHKWFVLNPVGQAKGLLACGRSTQVGCQNRRCVRNNTREPYGADGVVTIPRTCLARASSERREIDKAVATGEPLSNIAKHVSMSRAGLLRHESHVSQTIVKMPERREEKLGHSIFDGIKRT